MVAPFNIEFLEAILMQNLGEKSYFDGGLLQLIGWNLLGFFITICTVGICYPWAVCMVYNWETKHTVVEGRRLKFTGTAIGLFGLWIKWLLLCIITLGIYGFWVKISLLKWKVKHTEFASKIHIVWDQNTWRLNYYTPQIEIYRGLCLRGVLCYMVIFIHYL